MYFKFIQLLLAALQSYLQYFSFALKVHLFLPTLFNPLLKTLPNEEYSDLKCSTTFGLYPKSSPVKYSNLSNPPD